MAGLREERGGGFRWKAVLLESWWRCWRRKAAVFKTVLLVGKVRQSSCFCAHLCSGLTAGGVLLWKERGKERKAGVCQPYVRCKSAAKSAAAFRFCVHECWESDGEREKFIFRWNLLSKSGRCRRSKRGHGCMTRSRTLVRSELVSEIDWCRQVKSNLHCVGAKAITGFRATLAVCLHKAGNCDNSISHYQFSG
ncbi:MAG: hypothetical protein GY820_37920 [Gammaproteobacteria bacterium]|nr:hypothetical protein [Gammaproteobacteria bacterium]